MKAKLGSTLKINKLLKGYEKRWLLSHPCIYFRGYFMYKKISVAGIGFVNLLLLAGCAGYKAMPLRRLNAKNTFHMEDNFVYFDYKVLDAKECKTYLGRNVIAKGYQPIQVSIHNNSKHYFSLCLENLSLPVVHAYEVAESVHTNTVKRATVYGILGIFIWPFIIPAVVDGFGSKEANEKLDFDFAQKELRDQIIQPYCSVTGLIFVPINDFRSEFSLSIVDLDTTKTIEFSSTRLQAKVTTKF